ncbi:MAG: hypothetical protein EPN70_20780 [Paraburkholderia sp.]|uniref:hypothetical protein n=1 Tax=Paraburkholderia sp. TaxID=1926495 RepID=UPI00120B0C95|nr:hypothetical protein [Paraburkholderia sp.]TAM00967.1 MAG: hypothetical protein EPN70_20780 [Paraburkholderia sp.]
MNLSNAGGANSDALCTSQRNGRISKAEKLALLQESIRLGQSLVVVAQRYDIDPNLVLQWVLQQRNVASAIVQAGKSTRLARWLQIALTQVHQLQLLLHDRPHEHSMLQSLADLLTGVPVNDLILASGQLQCQASGTGDAGAV